MWVHAILVKLFVGRTQRDELVAPCRPAQDKSEAQITQEIQAIIRQITASVTFLPLLTDTCECGPWGS